MGASLTWNHAFAQYTCGCSPCSNAKVFFVMIMDLTIMSMWWSSPVFHSITRLKLSSQHVSVSRRELLQYSAIFRSFRVLMVFVAKENHLEWLVWTNFILPKWDVFSCPSVRHHRPFGIAESVAWTSIAAKQYLLSLLETNLGKLDISYSQLVLPKIIEGLYILHVTLGISCAVFSTAKSNHLLLFLLQSSSQQSCYQLSQF